MCLKLGMHVKEQPNYLLPKTKKRKQSIWEKFDDNLHQFTVMYIFFQFYYTTYKSISEKFQNLANTVSF